MGGVGLKIEKSVQAKINQKLLELTRKLAAPGFQLVLGWKDETLFSTAVGKQFPKRWSVRRSTRFDLASLTKVIATSTELMRARQDQVLRSLDTPVGEFFPFLRSALKEKTLRALLEHRAGLPPIFDLSQSADDTQISRELRGQFFLERVDAGFREEAPKPTYSDVGFMILGLVLEQIRGRSLREIFHRKYEMEFGPLTSYFPPFFHVAPSPPRSSITDSERGLEGKSGDPYQIGRVQDQRAEWWGGDAGHAGLFGTAEGVELWARQIYRAYFGKDLELSDRVVRDFIQLPLKALEQRFTGGFDTPDRPPKPSQAGKYFGPESFGHLGYTGTSFWMDLETGYRVILISHRYPRVERMRELRPLFHDWLMEEVFFRL